jgi:hypothetical protein
MRFGLVGLLVGALAALGCQSFDPQHPLVGRPRIPRRSVEPAYWIWYADGTWQLRMAAGRGRVHRFQGSIAGVNGLAELDPVEPELKEQIALVHQAVQFDVEGGHGEVRGFGARISNNGCARFDLYLDGEPHPERVYLGPRASPVKAVPFERCP